MSISTIWIWFVDPHAIPDLVLVSIYVHSAPREDSKPSFLHFSLLTKVTDHGVLAILLRNLRLHVGFSLNFNSMSKNICPNQQVHQQLGPARAHEGHPRSGLGLPEADDNLLCCLLLDPRE